MDKLTVRRKLLRGSLSAPLVLTVGSASAAATASVLQCIAYGANNQPTNSQFFATADGADGFFRMKVQVRHYSTTGGADKGTWYHDPVLNEWINVDTLDPANSGFPGTGWNYTNEDRWAIVWFSPTGQQSLITIQKPDTSYLAANVSCACSFL